jgi:LmbE family N-acetylglucosaminyl deacetylase
VTIFAAGPLPDHPLAEWDRASGFQPGEDVMARRREEDRRALSLLSAHPVWLSFHDSQYRRSPTCQDIGMVLHTLIQKIQPSAIVAPCGLFHSDHRLASEACLAVRRCFSHHAWVLYEDAIYRRIPDLLAERIGLLRGRGLHLRRITLHPEGNEARKSAAVSCYQSQLKALTTRGRPGYADVFEPERYWLLEPGVL